MANARTPRRQTDATYPVTTSTTRVIGVRLPARMTDQLEALARRENNGISAVVRRLLTAALSHEAA